MAGIALKGQCDLVSIMVPPKVSMKKKFNGRKENLADVEMAIFKTGNGERGTGNGGRGTGNGERGTGNGERGTGNGERGTGIGERGTGNGERYICKGIFHFNFHLCALRDFPL